MAADLPFTKPSSLYSLFTTKPLHYLFSPTKPPKLHFRKASPTRRPCSFSITSHLLDSSKPNTNDRLRTRVPTFVKFAPNEPRTGADILVEALEREGVTDVYALPGGVTTAEMHRALKGTPIINYNIPRKEELGPAIKYVRSSGKVGVCFIWSASSAPDLFEGLACTTHLVAITSQVPCVMNDAFQESPPMIKYLVLDIDNIPRIIHEAFSLARSAHQGTVFIVIPKYIQQKLAVPNWNLGFKWLPGYISRLPEQRKESNLERLLDHILESKKPVLYVGGGRLDSSKQLRRFLELTGIPVAINLNGLEGYPLWNGICQMLGMHGADYSNYAINNADLLLLIDVKFNNWVPGKLEAKVVQIDIDSTKMEKNKEQNHVSVALEGLVSLLEERGYSKSKLDFTCWRAELKEQQKTNSSAFKALGEVIPPQCAIKIVDELCEEDETMKYSIIRNMGLVIIGIDGDASFLNSYLIEHPLMKVVILNNKHLDLVVQWEDRYYKSNRVNTYMGNPSNESATFPDVLKLAEDFSIPAARVTKKSELKEAVRMMLEAPGPYLLDVILPHWEDVLTVIPG